MIPRQISTKQIVRSEKEAPTEVKKENDPNDLSGS